MAIYRWYSPGTHENKIIQIQSRRYDSLYKKEMDNKMKAGKLILKST